MIMLQIASGKLFQSEPGQRRELRGVLYTNLCLYMGTPIQTAAGRLLPVDSSHGAKTLVYEFTELIEQSPGPGVVASHGVEPYLNDFAAIVSFALNVTCTSIPDLTFRLTSGQPGPTLNVTPRQLVPRVFDGQVLCRKEDADRLVTVVRNLIGLERKSYLTAMRAVRTYVAGLHQHAEDLELAYTLLIASIESLAQGFTDDHPSKWADYDEERRRHIDRALVNADAKTARSVRSALLEIERLSIAKRFREFTIAHLQRSYFRQEAAGLVNPVGHTELPSVLREAYGLRSKYVHNLKDLPQLLTLGLASADTIQTTDGVTLLTLQGLSRLARHVITEFIARQPKVETEKYDYSNERLGIVRVPLAPQYWIGKAGNLKPSSGRKRLESFLQQVVTRLQKPNGVITDMGDVLTEVEKMLPKMKAAQRRPFLALYRVYNGLVPPSHQLQYLPKVQKQYKTESEGASVEAMLANLVLGTDPGWTLKEHRTVHDAYFDNRDKKSGLKVPRILEAGLSLELAERYRAANDPEYASELITFAVENCPGHAALYKLEEAFDSKAPISWRNVVLDVGV